MKSSDELLRILYRLDGKGYKGFREIAGSYQFDEFHLFVDHVQGDPFASPSRIRVRVEHSLAGIPAEFWNNRVRRIALQDFLIRQFHSAIRKYGRGIRGTGKSGLFAIDVGGQEVLERSALLITPQWLEVRFYMGLPARGRTILGRVAVQMFTEELPKIVAQSLFSRSISLTDAQDFVDCIENQEAIRQDLSQYGLIGFVADGSILPRESGASDRPMPSPQAVAFRSPDSLAVEVHLPNPASWNGRSTRVLRGMGIKPGVTLVVGGGYHGKSTLLKALERGVYPHIPGDGREYVVMHPQAVKIRAEDGRSVEKVNISPFISNLPNRKSTRAFSTDDASGSTSQAANILEAMEAGASVLLVDEDTSATNFMVRDARMQALVHKEDEPITPFVDRVRELFRQFGVSTVLVMGGSGDYLDVADRVIMMKSYLPLEVTERARQVASQLPTHRKQEPGEPFSAITQRIPLPGSFDPSRGRKEVKIDVKGLDRIVFGKTDIDLRSVEQLVDVSQTRAVAHAIYLALQRFIDGKTPIKPILDQLEELLETKGLDILDPFHREGKHPGDFARPRMLEIAAAINRMRTLRLKQQT